MPAARLGRDIVIASSAGWIRHRLVTLLWTEPPLGSAAVVITNAVKAVRELFSAFKVVALLAVLAAIVILVLKARPLIRWIAVLVLLLGAFVVVRSRGSSASETSTIRGIDQIRPSVGDAEQLVVVHAAEQTDTEATAETFEKRAGTWHSVQGPMAARLGRNGLSEAHKEGDGTTPVGVFTMHEAFGIKALNGLSLPYRIVGPDDWWVSDSSKPAIYNTWQTTTPDEHGNPTRWDPAHAEHLSTFGTAYNYAAVIDYNRPPDVPAPVPGNGSGIFLHVSTGKPTSGCVAIGSDALVSILKWLDPTKHPRIVIGTDRWMLETTPAPEVQGTKDPGGFDRVVPTRVLDTRRPSRPGGSGPLGPDGVLDLDVNRDLDGNVRAAPLVPADATAIALNLTLTDQTDETYLTAYPTPTDGAAPPTASNVNASPGEDRANLVIVRRGDGGKVRIFNKHGSAHVARCCREPVSHRRHARRHGWSRPQVERG
jgi:L,D-peptidoglycan transpeptidase YkuD (ErfK/YbiS/YcfS/YnhG family)